MAAIWRGFRIEQPSILFHGEFQRAGCSNFSLGCRCAVSYGYFATSCVSLGGLQHELAFHFEGERLSELEFSWASYPADLSASFADFQRHLRGHIRTPRRLKNWRRWLPGIRVVSSRWRGAAFRREPFRTGRACSNKARLPVARSLASSILVKLKTGEI
jgi:hypothetical protein